MNRNWPAFLKLAGAGGILAGILGLLTEVHVIPYRDLFDFSPRNLVFVLQLDAGLRTQYVLHFSLMAVAALAALPAAYALNRVLRTRLDKTLPALAFALTAVGLAVFLYASGVNAIMFPRLAQALEEGDMTTLAASVTARQINNHTILVVSLGGAGFLGGVLLFSYAIWRTGLLPRWVGALGFVAVGLLALFGALIYANRLPFIWAVTFPPPPEYLLSLWFIFVGWGLLRRANITNTLA